MQGGTKKADLAVFLNLQEFKLILVDFDNGSRKKVRARWGTSEYFPRGYHRPIPDVNRNGKFPPRGGDGFYIGLTELMSPFQVWIIQFAVM